MEIIRRYLTENDCYQAGAYMNPSHVQWHSIGTPQPDADVLANNWNRAGVNKMVHALIEPGRVIEIMQYNKRPWADRGFGNKHAITFEMTEPSTIKYTGGASYIDLNPAATKAHVLAVYKTAVEYTAYLCKKYNFNPLAKNYGVPVVFSHREGALMGISSNHGDPDHLLKKYGLSMDTARRDVQKLLDGGNIDIDTKPIKPDKPIVPDKPTVYKTGRYKVNDPELNIRCVPRAVSKDDIVGEITDNGIYTIVEIQNGSWGRLSSGAGWINCSTTYCTYLGEAKEDDPKPVVPTKTDVKAVYRVRTQAHGWLGEISEYTDYAGWKESPITAVAIKVSHGTIKYRVHVVGGGWLNWITNYDINNGATGYAGNGKPIDAIEVYYKTPDSIRPYQRAVYQVAPTNGNWYPEQIDSQVGSGMDGYAGAFGKKIGKFRLKIQ